MSMLFDGWYDLVRILVVGICAYFGLVVILRITGKRTLAKMNAFDLIVTISLGSTLASALLSSDVSLAEGLLAFALLCGLQFLVAYGSTRSTKIRNLVKATPSLLFYRGRFDHAMMARERVAEEEVFAAIRAEGLAALDSVDAVVLETDGSFSVLHGAQATPPDMLRGVNASEIRFPG